MLAIGLYNISPSSRSNVIKFTLVGPLDTDILYPMIEISVSFTAAPRTAALLHRQQKLLGYFLTIA